MNIQQNQFFRKYIILTLLLITGLFSTSYAEEKKAFQVSWKQGAIYKFILSTSIELGEPQDGKNLLTTNIPQVLSVLELRDGKALVKSAQERVVSGQPRADGSYVREMIPVMIEFDRSGRVVGAADAKNEFLFGEFLPEKPVSVGDTWEISSQKLNDLGFQLPPNQQNKIICQYKGIVDEKGTKVAKIDLKFSKIEGKDESAFGVGVILVDQTDGMLHSMSININFPTLPAIVNMKPTFKSLRMTASRL